MPKRRTTRARHARRHDCGFTLVELLSVLVILGSVGTITLTAAMNLRQDARYATFVTTAANMRANVYAARLTYQTSFTPGADGASGPTGAVRIGGKSVEVNGAGSSMPEGAPTGIGMWTMLECGPLPPADNVLVPCEGLPGLQARIWVDLQRVNLQYNNNCNLYYNAISVDLGAFGVVLPAVWSGCKR